MKNVITWFEIYVENFDRAKNFYRQVLKCRIEDIPVDNERHAQMKYATLCNRRCWKLPFPYFYRK